MVSIMCRILRSGAMQYRAVLGNMYARGMTSSGASGGFDNKGGQGDDEDKVCPICKGADCKACCPPVYDCRKFGHGLPENSRKHDFDCIPNIPSDVFRCTSGEFLGPMGGARKCTCYPNPEYFSYHHMSYYDVHLVLRPNRLQSPQTKRKP